MNEDSFIEMAKVRSDRGLRAQQLELRAAAYRLPGQVYGNAGWNEERQMKTLGAATLAFVVSLAAGAVLFGFHYDKVPKGEVTISEVAADSTGVLYAAAPVAQQASHRNL
jgi:hypothetical protein